MNKILLALSVAILYQGCRSPLVYITNNIPIPLIERVGETQMAGQYGTNGKSFNLVSSPLDYVSISIAGNYDNATVNSGIPDKKLENNNIHNYTEVAVGYYGVPSDSYIGEVFAGYGWGDGKDDYYEQNSSFLFGSNLVVHHDISYGKYEKYFLQANLGKKNNLFTTGFALRLSYVNFYELTKIHEEGATLPLNQRSPTFPSKKEALFFEPTFFAKISGKNVELEIEVMFPYTSKDIDFDYKSYLISTGLRFIF